MSTALLCRDGADLLQLHLRWPTGKQR